MNPQRPALIIILLIATGLFVGCTDESVVLKQKISELEKRLQKEENNLKDFAGKFAPPKDFSADIQRIEDQQDKVAQIIKTQVEPVNTKLEEFRDWAQEAQKEREQVGKKLKSMEHALGEAQKKIDGERGDAGKLSKDVASNKKAVHSLVKQIDDLSKNQAEVRKDLQENNQKIIEAVKKTLPKVKDAAVADMKSQITPLEQHLVALKAAMENDRKNIAGLKAQQAPTDSGGKDVQLLVKRIRELEEIVTAQKSFLLEMGSKMHELELQLRGVSNSGGGPRPLSRR